MGANASCCASTPQKNIKPHPKQTNSLPLPNLNRNSSVPYSAKEETPPHENVALSKLDRPNGYISERDLLKVIDKPATSNSDLSLHEGKESQPVLAKTFTTPNLDKEDTKPAFGHNWEHTQSLDTFIEEGSEKKVEHNVSQEFIEISLKNVEEEDTGESENVIRKSHSVTVTQEKVLNGVANETEDEDYQECCSTETTTKAVSNNESAGSSVYHNIFDVEFRRHNEGVARSNHNSYNSTPSPTAVPKNSENNRIRVTAEINVDDDGHLLYSAIVKRGSRQNSVN